MHLLDLESESFLGLPDGKYSFSRAEGVPLPLVLIGGGPSSGKTSLLEAIIALKESVGTMHVLREPSRFLRSGAKAGRLSGTWLLTAEEQARAGLDEPTYTAELSLVGGPVRAPEPALEEVFKGRSSESGVGRFEYFPCNRQLERRPGQALEALSPLRLTRRSDKYAGIEQALLRLAVADGLAALARIESDGILLKGDQRDSLAGYRAAIAALCPRLRLTGVELADSEAFVWFERDDGATVELYGLSHGEQQGVLFALTYMVYSLRRSLVLIDEPELHIHPGARLRFLNALAGLGEGNQIIAATSASELLEGVPRHQVITLGVKPG
jgi:hypothetical protein